MVQSKRQKWRKIDTSEIDQARDFSWLKAKIDEKSDSKLFTVSTSTSIPKKTIIKKIRDHSPGIQKISKKNTVKQLPLSKKKQKVPNGGTVYNLWETTEITSVRPTLAAPIQTQLVPAVKFPHPVESYNPNSSDFKAAIQDIIDKQNIEEEKEKEKAYYNKPLTRQLLNHYPKELVEKMGMNNKIKALQLLQRGLLLEEIKADEPQEEVISEEGDSDQDEEGLLIRQAKKKKKTKTQKNKEKRKIKEMVKSKINRKEKEFMASFNHLGNLISEVEDKEKFTKDKLIRKKQKSDKILSLMSIGIVPKKRFGKYTFVEEEPEIPINSEMAAASLRSLKVKGNAAKERINSFYRRQMLEPPPPLNAAYTSRVRYAEYQKRKSRKTGLPASLEALKPIVKSR